nr:hypothetical protein K-LCC10_0195 [Kaumoebavirus]
MGNANGRRPHRQVGVVRQQTIITFVTTMNADTVENYVFGDEDKERLVRDLSHEFPYITFTINTATNYLEWGINKARADYGMDISYDGRLRRLNLDGDVSQEILNYEHILGKVRLIVMDTTEAKSIFLIEEMKRQREMIEERVDEKLNPIIEKMNAIFTLLDSIPGSPGYLEARTHFKARRQSL